MLRTSAVVAVFALALWAAPQAGATVLFEGTGSGLSATASFTISGAAGSRQLTILLTNTDTASGDGAPTASNQVLSGLFFNLGTTAFTPVSATLKDSGGNVIGEIIQEDECSKTCVGKINVGGEFSYALGGASWLTGTNQGISSSGYLNAATNMGNFNGPNYDNPAALGGINFGIVPTGWVEGSGNGGLDNDPLVAGTIRFVLSIPDGLGEDEISSVYFTYGTDSKEPSIPGTGPGPGGGPGGGSVPEPGVLSLLAVSLAGGAYRLRRRNIL